jgi:D-alanyl-lipoteichoic acid acyltransferase DltB (MBOAT superfamily)
MLFNSYIFILVFLPIVLLGYFLFNRTQHPTLAKIWLVTSSLFFYSWWNVAYLPLILASIFVNYGISIAMSKNTPYKKTFFILGLLFNVGLLVYYKYMDFFISNINTIAETQFSLLHLVLPLGISFFTLQQTAFLVDSYQGLVKERKFMDYALFVSFFPQLIAGPIVHHKVMMPQFANTNNTSINTSNIARGLFLFSIGLFKKVMIADYLAIYVKEGFDKHDHLNFLDAWQASLSYTFQLYYDFSAYSDMAIGVALMFNIMLPQNFNSPLKATGMIDYWKRWHLTLTNFITSYIYTPLMRAFTPLTFNKAMVITLITFLISGMWHGAGWTFIFWGFLHGIGVITNHYWQKKSKIRLHWILAWFITFNFVNFGNVFFRAKDFHDAVKVLHGMIDYHSFALSIQIKESLSFLSNYPIFYKHPNHVHALYFLLFAFILTFAFKNVSSTIHTRKLNTITLLWASILFSISLLSMDKVSEFIYFNF